MALRKRGTIFGAVLLAVLATLFEAARELYAYHRVSRRYEEAFLILRPRMRQEDVLEVVGQPDFASLHESDQTWNWSATEHQGYVWRMERA